MGYEPLRDQLAEMTKQRDELLAALIVAERALSEIAMQCGPLSTIHDWHRKAIAKSRAAIADAEARQ